MSKVLVFWKNSNQTSIVPICAVSDKRMLTDNKRCGKVKWMGEGDAKKKPPKDGWSTHDGRVLCVSEKASELREKEEEFWRVERIEEKTTEKRVHDEDSKDVEDCGSDKPVSKKLKSKREKSAVIMASQSIFSQMSTSSSRIDENETNAVADENSTKIPVPWLCVQKESVSTSISVNNEDDYQSLRQQVNKYKNDCLRLEQERDEAVSAMKRMEKTLIKLKEDLPNMIEYIGNMLNEAVSGKSMLPSNMPRVMGPTFASKSNQQLTLLPGQQGSSCTVARSTDMKTNKEGFGMVETASTLANTPPSHRPSSTSVGPQASTPTFNVGRVFSLNNAGSSYQPTKITSSDVHSKVASISATPACSRSQSIPLRQQVSTASPNFVSATNEATSCNMIDLGSGIKVMQSKLSLLRHDRPTVLARQLMEVLFSNEELSTSSVTGRASNKKPGQVPKPALDPSRVSALLTYVRTKYPNAIDRLVKTAMAEKLQEFRGSTLELSSNKDTQEQVVDVDDSAEQELSEMRLFC